MLSRLNTSLVDRPAALKPIAMLLFDMTNWTYTWYRPDGPIEPEQLANMAADLFLNGLGQPV